MLLCLLFEVVDDDDFLDFFSIIFFVIEFIIDKFMFFFIIFFFLIFIILIVILILLILFVGCKKVVFLFSKFVVFIVLVIGFLNGLWCFFCWISIVFFGNDGVVFLRCNGCGIRLVDFGLVVIILIFFKVVIEGLWFLV